MMLNSGPCTDTHTYRHGHTPMNIYISKQAHIQRDYCETYFETTYGKQRTIQVIDVDNNFLNRNLKAQEISGIDKWDCGNLQGFYTTKKNGMKKSVFRMEKI